MKSKPSIQRLLCAAEVADLLGLTTKGVYSLVQGRKIPFIKISNRLRFDRNDVLEWIQENRVSSLEKKP